jgi:formylglycine-generating enzyme required for sulfatase activity
LSAAGANEALPINCVHWYDAFQFCAWDGGWLPTEAEWEMAAAGGAENRRYPWGGALPNASPLCANVRETSEFCPISGEGEKVSDAC